MKIKKTMTSVVACALALSAMSSVATTAFAEDTAVPTSETAATAAVNYASAKTVSYDLTDPYNSFDVTLKGGCNNIALDKDTASIHINSNLFGDLTEYLVDSKGRTATVLYDLVEIKVTAKTGDNTATAIVSSDTASEFYSRTFEDAHTDLSYGQMKSRMAKGYSFSLGEFDESFRSFKQVDNTLVSISEDEITKDALPFGDLDSLAVSKLSVEYKLRVRTISRVPEDVSKEYIKSLKSDTHEMGIGTYAKNSTTLMSVVPYNISDKKVSTLATMLGIDSYDSVKKQFTYTSDSNGTILKNKMDAYVTAAQSDMAASIKSLDIYKLYEASGLTPEAFASAVDTEIKGMLEVSLGDEKFDSEAEAEEAMRNAMLDYASTTKYLSGLSAADLMGLTKGSKTTVEGDTTGTGSYSYALDGDVTTLKRVLIVDKDDRTQDVLINDTIKNNIDNNISKVVNGVSVLSSTFATDTSITDKTCANFKNHLKTHITDRLGDVSAETVFNTLYGTADIVIRDDAGTIVADGATISGTAAYTVEFTDSATKLGNVKSKVCHIYMDGVELEATSDDYKAAASAVPTAYKTTGSAANRTISVEYKANVTKTEKTQTEKLEKYIGAINAKVADIYGAMGWYNVKKEKNADDVEVYVTSDTLIKDANGLKNVITTLVKALTDDKSMGDLEKLNALIKDDATVRAMVRPSAEFDADKGTIAVGTSIYNDPISIESKIWHYFVEEYDYRNSCYFLAEIVDTIGASKGAIVSFHVDPNSLKKNEELVLAYVDAFDARKFFSNKLEGEMVLRVNGTSTNAFTNLIAYDEKTSTISFQWDDVTGAKYTDNVLYARTLDIMSSLSFDIDAVQITIPDQAQFAEKPPVVEEKPEDKPEDKEDNTIIEDNDTEEPEVDDKPVADEDNFEDGDDDLSSGESEENNSVIVEDEDTEGGDDMDDIDLGNDDIFGDDSINDIFGDGDTTDSDVPVVDNVQPTPVVPVDPTPIKPEGGTPSTGDAGVAMSIPAILTGVAVAIKKRITK